MSSREHADGLIDLAHDVPTTAEDVEVLRRLRREASSWLWLSADEFETLVPEDALDRRRALRPDPTPFALP